jgi:colicin import membrane protein
LQPYSNNNRRKFPPDKGKGLAGTIIIHLAIFLLLISLAFSAPPPPQSEEGIMVNFGTDETGLGMIEPSPPAIQEETTPPPPSAAKVKPKEEALITQNTDEAPAVKKADPEAEKKKLEKAEADKKIKEQREAERKVKAQEEAERKKIEADQQRQTDIMNMTKNALANSKNAGTSSTSEGIAGGPGNQGVPTGSVDSKVYGPGGGSGTGGQGNSYDLQGRKVSQALPIPKYEIQEGGRVVVEVSVDRDGKVVQAVPGYKGTSTLDEYLLKAAKDAAMKARFEVKPDAPVIQKGTITYNFILK